MQSLQSTPVCFILDKALLGMNDATTTIDTLRSLVRRFVDERRWNVFHTPKNLAMSLAIEAAELMEHFQWLTPDEARAVGDDPARRPAAGEELPDVLCYALALAHELKLDIASTVVDKMAKNALKYPVDQYQGRWGASDTRPATS